MGLELRGPRPVDPPFVTLPIIRRWNEVSLVARRPGGRCSTDFASDLDLGDPD
jgi:hypothetical protein